jgi:hypothetical protein
MDLTARLDEILRKDFEGRVRSLLPVIELLVPTWADSEWAEEADGGAPVIPALALLRRIAAGGAPSTADITNAAAACLEHLAGMEDAYNEDPQIAVTSLAVGLPAFLLGEAAQHAGIDLELPSTLTDVVHGGIPHLISVTADPAPFEKALGLG